MDRRRYLVAGVGCLSLAGCLSVGDDGSEGTGGERNQTSNDGDADEDDAHSDGDSEPTEWPTGPYADWATTEVAVTTPDGEELAGVTAAIAQESADRMQGLSDATTLPENGGMLFVFDSPADRTFVMREMDFGIDIVFADANREITEIHHAPAPGPDEDGSQQRYGGHGQYVLEVGYEWTVDHGVDVGDLLKFEL